MTQPMPPGRFDSRASTGLLVSLAGAAFSGRAARGSISPRKATCEVPDERDLHLVQGRRRAQKGQRASSRSSTRTKQGDDLEEMTK